MARSQAAVLLVDYYEGFLRSQDIDAFRISVMARYTEGTLARLLQMGEPQARRAAVLALGLHATFSSNDAVGRALRDPDPVVRNLAHNALWAIWFRGDRPEQAERIQAIASLIERRDLTAAIDRADELIADAPNFAEAYNQRAIARFFLGRYDESAGDCRMAIERNPFHFGALAGLARCQMNLGQRREALRTFRRALKIEPYNTNLRDMVRAMEAEEA